MFESFGTADGPDGLAYEVVEKVDRSCYLMGHREGYGYGEDGVNHTIHEIPAETMKGSLVKPVKINSVWSDGEYVEDALLIGAAEGFDDVGFDDKLHYIGKTFGQDSGLLHDRLLPPTSSLLRSSRQHTASITYENVE